MKIQSSVGLCGVVSIEIDGNSHLITFVDGIAEVDDEIGYSVIDSHPSFQEVKEIPKETFPESSEKEKKGESDKSSKIASDTEKSTEKKSTTKT